MQYIDKYITTKDQIPKPGSITPETALDNLSKLNYKDTKQIGELYLQLSNTVSGPIKVSSTNAKAFAVAADPAAALTLYKPEVPAKPGSPAKPEPPKSATASPTSPGNKIHPIIMSVTVVGQDAAKEKSIPQLVMPLGRLQRMDLDEGQEEFWDTQYVVVVDAIDPSHPVWLLCSRTLMTDEGEEVKLNLDDTYPVFPSVSQIFNAAKLFAAFQDWIDNTDKAGYMDTVVECVKNSLVSDAIDVEPAKSDDVLKLIGSEKPKEDQGNSTGGTDGAQGSTTGGSGNATKGSENKTGGQGGSNENSGNSSGGNQGSSTDTSGNTTGGQGTSHENSGNTTGGSQGGCTDTSGNTTSGQGTSNENSGNSTGGNQGSSTDTSGNSTGGTQGGSTNNSGNTGGNQGGSTNTSDNTTQGIQGGSTDNSGNTTSSNQGTSTDSSGNTTGGGQGSSNENTEDATGSSTAGGSGNTMGGSG